MSSECGLCILYNVECRPLIHIQYIRWAVWVMWVWVVCLHEGHEGLCVIHERECLGRELFLLAGMHACCHASRPLFPSLFVCKSPVRLNGWKEVPGPEYRARVPSATGRSNRFCHLCRPLGHRHILSGQKSDNPVWTAQFRWNGFLRVRPCMIVWKKGAIWLWNVEE